jgi:hypothetical protein
VAAPQLHTHPNLKPHHNTESCYAKSCCAESCYAESCCRNLHMK